MLGINIGIIGYILGINIGIVGCIYIYIYILGLYGDYRVYLGFNIGIIGYLCIY